MCSPDWISEKIFYSHFLAGFLNAYTVENSRQRPPKMWRFSGRLQKEVASENQNTVLSFEKMPWYIFLANNLLHAISK